MPTRIVLACVALLGALATPITAFAHGVAHEQEMTDRHASVGSAAGAGEETAVIDRSVQDDDGDADHPVLHASQVASQRDQASLIALPLSRTAVAHIAIECRRAAVWVAPPPASHPPPRALQPRAPP